MPGHTSSSNPLPDRRGRAVAFAITWLSYATYYMGRKGFSVAKSAIVDQFGPRALTFYHPSKYISVGVETAYLTAYALGQYVSGSLGDRIGARRLVSTGMLVSAAAWRQPSAAR